MPKANPKRSSAYTRYYRRARNAQLTEHVKDRTPMYYGLAFVGIIVVIVVIVIVVTVPGTSGITTQKNDVVNLAYVGTLDNGTIFDSNTLPSVTIGNNQLLTYFDQNLVNRPVGQPFSFVVPAAQGYQSSQVATHDGHNYQLYGENLHFQVTVTMLLRNGKTLYPTS